MLQVISCKAAVAWEAKQPLSIETVEVEPPKEGEVRVQVNHTHLTRHVHFTILRSEPHLSEGCLLLIRVVL